LLFLLRYSIIKKVKIRRALPCVGQKARKGKNMFGIGKNKKNPGEEVVEFNGSNLDLFTRVTLDSVSKHTRIIVPATHSAIVLNNGKLTQTLDGGEHYIDPNGIHGDAKVDVIFLSKTVRIQCLFGTPSPITLRDPSTEVVVEAGVRGSFDVNIENPRQAYLELIGVIDTFNIDDLKKRLAILMTARIGSVLADVTYSEKISYDMFDFSKEKIEKLIMERLEEEFRTQYGVKLFSLIVEKIFMSEENQQKIENARNTIKEEENAKGGKLFCTKCGNQIKKGDVFCSKCGERVVQFGEVCPTCGESNDPAAAFCKSCGRKLK